MPCIKINGLYLTRWLRLNKYTWIYFSWQLHNVVRELCVCLSLHKQNSQNGIKMNATLLYTYLIEIHFCPHFMLMNIWLMIYYNNKTLCLYLFSWTYTMFILILITKTQLGVEYIILVSRYLFSFDYARVNWVTI